MVLPVEMRLSSDPLHAIITDSRHTREKMPVAFVLQVGALGLGVVRSLGRNGIKVVGFDYDPRAPGLFSKFCRPVLCPDPQTNPEGIVELLVEEGGRLDEKGVLYPCSDPMALVVSRNRRVLGEYFKFMIPSEEILEGTVNKRQLYDWAEKIGIPYPQTFYPKDWSDLEDAKDQISFPVFVKPYYSHLFYRRFQTKGFVIYDYEHLVEKYKLIFPSGLDTMVQRVIPGPDSNMVCVCTYIGRKDVPLGVLVHQKIRQYPKGFGLGALSRTIHDEDLASIGLRFYKGTGYRGIGEIEFKKDEKDGVFNLIELNARPWLQNLQATYAGMNFPLMQYLDLLEQEIDPIEDYRDGVRYYDTINDIKSYLQYRESRSLAFGDWVRSWLGAECHAHFAWDDLRPSLVRSGYGAEFGRLAYGIMRDSTEHILRSRSSPHPVMDEESQN